MERRTSERLIVNLKAERISCIENCSVFIENLSENGIYMITAPAKNSNFIPGSELDIELQLSPEKTINLQCSVKWAYNNEPDDLTHSVGLEIIEPPQEYKDFITTLN